MLEKNWIEFGRIEISPSFPLNQNGYRTPFGQTIENTVILISILELNSFQRNMPPSLVLAPNEKQQKKLHPKAKIYIKSRN